MYYSILRTLKANYIKIKWMELEIYNTHGVLWISGEIKDRKWKSRAKIYFAGLSWFNASQN